MECLTVICPHGWGFPGIWEAYTLTTPPSPPEVPGKKDTFPLLVYYLYDPRTEEA